MITTMHLLFLSEDLISCKTSSTYIPIDRNDVFSVVIIIIFTTTCIE